MPAPRSHRSFASLLLVTSMLGCAVEPAVPLSRAQAVSGGVHDTAHPGVGALGVRYEGGFWPMCSGALIAPTVFLTAGHCAAAVNAWDDDTLVTFEDRLTSASVTVRGVAIAHPDFSADRPILHGQNVDVAVVILDHPVDLPLARLAPEGATDALSPRDPITVVGYGMERVGSVPDFAYGPMTERRAGTLSFRGTSQRLIQLSVLAAQGNDGICFGDSGGPVLAARDGREEVIGVGSAVNSYACNATAWYGRVDTAAARGFLRRWVTLP